MLDTLRGSAVTLVTTDGKVHGRIAMVEKIEDPGKQGEPPRIDHRISLLDGDSMRVVLLSTVRTVRLDDGDLALQFNRTLDASAGEGMFQQVAVLDPPRRRMKSHDLLLVHGYVVAAPMWKPTYRVVLPEGGKGKALLQAWAVVDNTSGEEWPTMSHLALHVRRADVAFRYDLHTPRTVERPDLTARGVPHQADAVMVGETTYDLAPSRRRPATATTAGTGGRDATAGACSLPLERQEDRREEQVEGRQLRCRPRLRERPDERRADDRRGEHAAGHRHRPKLRQSTLAVARPIRTASGQTRFELGEARDGARGHVDDGRDLDERRRRGARRRSCFARAAPAMATSPSPYRVVRFKNSTPFVFEPGPIGIYAGGSFVGEGLSETVGAATSATIPFAVEPGIMVTSVTGDDRDDMHLVKMSRGVLEGEQFARHTTTYTVKAQTNDAGFTVLVRHPKLGGTFTLANRPTGTEDLPDAYMVRLEVAKGSAARAR